MAKPRASLRHAPSRWRAQARFLKAGSSRPFRSRAASFPLRQIGPAAGRVTIAVAAVAAVVAAAVGRVVAWAAEWVEDMVVGAVAAGWVVAAVAGAVEWRVAWAAVRPATPEGAMHRGEVVDNSAARCHR